jgi:DNA mismatch repair protein MutS2
MKVFPPSANERIGFDVVRARVARFLESQQGRDMYEAEGSLSDPIRIKSALDRVAELQQMLRFDDPVPFGAVPDIRGALRAAAPDGASLSTELLLDVGAWLGVSRRLGAYLIRRAENYPLLSAIGRRMPAVPALEERISRSIDPDGRVRDQASRELSEIRQGIQNREVQLRSTLQRELRAAIGSGYATEEQPTVRAGRMVIPIRAEARRKVPGFVHDASATGQTVYLEPAACLDLNNEIRELQAGERREIDRILRSITSDVRDRLAEMRDGLDALALFDVVHAKARFSNRIDATVPLLTDDGVIELIDARNPVLALMFTEQQETEKRSVVPLDLTLGKEFSTLIVTGPNAGGKTVAMKTVGLVALMLCHGIPVPVDEKSRFPIFQSLMVEIGDDQSIEDDLSTFSSHVTHLRRIVEEADGQTLVLIDEAGTGTDPTEGAALAQAVLEVLTERGVRVIATTHHGTLKAFARATEGVENGSMEFDRSTLSPTYRFLAGRPGSSYAFEIAQRTGMQSEVLDRSRDLVGEQKTGLEDLIADYEEKSRRLQVLLDEATGDREKAQRQRRILESRLHDLKSERDSIRQRALDDATQILAEANARVERTIREIREADAAKDTTREARDRLDSFRESVERARRKRRPERSTVKRESTPTPLSVGDQVVLDGGSTAMEILSIEGKDAVVGQGAMRLKVQQSRLTKVGGKPKQRVTVREVNASIPAGSARARIDLRGQRVDEALMEVDRFIDDAIRSGLSRLEILHGKGTGALRLAIQERLGTVPDVASFDEAPWDEGGAGVTIVVMR